MEYIGTPTAPRAVISRASVSSAARRVASFSIITTAATFDPLTSSGCASGAFHEDTKFDAQAPSASAVASRSRFRMVMIASSGKR
jgi:hypothetical protein